VRERKDPQAVSRALEACIMTIDSPRSIGTSLKKTGRVFGPLLPLLFHYFGTAYSVVLSLYQAGVALLSGLVMERIGPPLLGSLLALSSGALVYVGATHLLPQAEKEHRKYSLCALGAGILNMR
jgi:hypothetical protein